MNDFAPDIVDNRLVVRIIHLEDDEEFVQAFPDIFEAHFSNFYPALVSVGYKWVKSLRELHSELKSAVGLQIPPIVIFDLRDDAADEDEEDAVYGGLTELENRLQEFHEFNVVPVVYSAVLGEQIEKTGRNTIYEYLVNDKKFDGVIIARKGAHAGARELVAIVEKQVMKLLEAYIAHPKGENIVGQKEDPALGFNLFVNDISIRNQPIVAMIGDLQKLRVEMTVEEKARNGTETLIGENLDIAVLCENCEPEFQLHSFGINHVGKTVQHTFTFRLDANSNSDREIKVMYYHDNYMLAIQYIRLNTKNK